MTFLRGLTKQSEVVFAVVLRETRTRFGANQLGYLWALLEPSIVILSFYVVFRLLGRPAPVGMDQFSFIATGVVPYTLFSNSVQRVAEAINGNKALLYYPQVQPLDLVIARSLLEAATFMAVLFLLLGGNALVTKHLELDSALEVIGGMCLASMLGTSLGLIFCGLSQLSSVADRARGPILRPLFWVSGIFFTAESLPDNARAAMLVNPVLHATELVRDGWFRSYQDDHVDLVYAMSWVMVLTLIGLILERAVRRKIEMT